MSVKLEIEINDKMTSFHRMRMNELLSATVSQDDGGAGMMAWITVREHKTGSTGTCKLAFSGNKVLDLLR